MEKEDNGVSSAVNAGVHASTGFEFQKHCALYFLVERYEDLKCKKYFISFENHDDFLFCYKTNDELIFLIECYQAKKSSTQWTLGGRMYEIIKKMIDVGLCLKEDGHPKTNNYKHSLNFITNNSIKLVAGKSKDKVEVTINESNSKVKFLELDNKIVTKIVNGIEKLINSDLEELNESDNISIEYIDLPKSSKLQKDCLVGLFKRKFGDKVRDEVAAVDTLLLLFRDVETTLNQGNVAKLMDESKRVSCESINSTIEVITTKKMAFELWREEKKEICKKLKISIPNMRIFERDFDNSFDRFKDLEQVEHNKILSFVRENRSLLYEFTEQIECIEELYNSFVNKISSQLSEISIKAAIYAAYIEVRETL